MKMQPTVKFRHLLQSEVLSVERYGQRHGQRMCKCALMIFSIFFPTGFCMLVAGSRTVCGVSEVANIKV